MIETVIEFRAFAAAKQQYDSAATKKDVPRTPMVEMVKAIEFERVQAAFEERKRRRDERQPDD